MHIQSILAVIAHACHGHTLQLGCLSRTVGKWLVVTLLEVSEKEYSIVALYLPYGPLRTCSGLDPVPRCKPSTYQPISQ